MGSVTDVCFGRPVDLVKAAFITPFDLYPFQGDAVTRLAPLPRSALYWEPGLGKTAGATHCMLYKMAIDEIDVSVILLPPILIDLWARWLAKITRADGTPLKVVIYRGSPAQRNQIRFDGSEIVLMSIQIFKKDIERIERETSGRRCHVVVDEAHCLKDVGTGNYKTLRDFAADKSLQLLTGTPLNSPGDAYAYVKLLSPSIYRNLKQFELIHVGERDFFNNVSKWSNLDLLQQNLMHNADRKTKEEVLLDLPECTIMPIHYELDPKHLKLYRKMVDEQLLKLPDGDKIDLTQSTALYHALGQIVMQWHYFGQDPELKSAGYTLIEQVLDELGDKKLIVFANYQRTNQEIVRRYNCSGVWGEISPTNKQRAIDRFIDDPKCRIITLQPTSGGVGIDGLQHVCADIIYVEPPVAVTHLTQSLSRVHRDGQREAVTVRLGLATGTVQHMRVKALTAKEALVNPLQMSRARLRDALYGLT